MTSKLRSALRWASNRAWSRAGAIAEVMSAEAPRRALVVTTRMALVGVGSVVIAVAVSLMLWNSFGPGPLDVFIGGVSRRTGLPLAAAVWATAALMATVAWLFGRRPGIGTVVAPFLIGPIMQFSLAQLAAAPAPNSVVAQVCVHLVAIMAVGIGAGALIVSGLGAGTGELLAAAASDRFGTPEPLVRLATEVGWISVGVLLGGPIGPGSLLVAALVGPAVVNGHRWVDAAVSGSRKGVAATGTAVARYAATANAETARETDTEMDTETDTGADTDASGDRLVFASRS